MDPQNNQPAQINSPQNYQAPAKQKSKLVLFLILVIAILVGGSAFGAYSLNKSLQKTKKELNITRSERDSANTDLTEAKNKIAELDNPQKKKNDEKRKKDLALFISAINKYKADKGTYPSTEPTFFAKEFSDIYVKGKLINFIDPNTKEAYAFEPVAKVHTPSGVTLGKIQYQWPGECTGSEFKDADDESKAAARILLETGEIYCLNSF